MADRAAVRFRESMVLPRLELARRPAAAERRRRAGELRSLQHDQPVRAGCAGRLAARRDGGRGHAGDRPAPAGPGCGPAQACVSRRRRRPRHGRWYCGSTASAIRIRSSWPACTASSRTHRLSCARSRPRWRRSRPTARSPRDRGQPAATPTNGPSPGARHRCEAAAVRRRSGGERVGLRRSRHRQDGHDLPRHPSGRGLTAGV